MSEHEITNANDEAGSQDERDSAAAKVVESLIGIGRVWAAHGLRIGRSSLEASATTLKSTARLLGDLSDRFASEAEEPEKQT
jgi:hypothetical protein